MTDPGSDGGRAQVVGTDDSGGQQAAGTATGPVDWSVARRTALAVAARQQPLPGYVRKAMEADFAELTAEAEALVEEETGLRSLAGPARARVTDRQGWVEANVASFRRLLEPLAVKMARAGQAGRMPPAVSRTASGAQIGLLLGWLSSRVLGQYDQLLVEDDHPEDQDLVYYVGTNVAAIERKYDFPPREFRLWISLHEVTHRAQFTGVPWMRPYFLSLLSGTVEGFDPDPHRLLIALRRSVEGLRAGVNPLDEGGLMSLLATPEQAEVLRKVGGLMSLLEGHGDVTMDRAGADRIPNAARFSAVLSQRRQQRGAAKVVSSLIGLDAKMRQYEQGERFIEAVEHAGGRDLLDRVWRGPQWLPDWAEIRQPGRWIERTAKLLSASEIGPAPGAA
ncbi:MAG TPA: zinc-dependent metalloprotease [Acidimicrobiales bacterium]|nr:zinc-dependent metalloprotease [Acidimicrobiales bacterium]